MVVASKPLSTIGVFWVVCWIDIFLNQTFLNTKYFIYFLGSWVCLSSTMLSSVYCEHRTCVGDLNVRKPELSSSLRDRRPWIFYRRLQRLSKLRSKFWSNFFAKLRIICEIWFLFPALAKICILKCFVLNHPRIHALIYITFKLDP